MNPIVARLRKVTTEIASRSFGLVRTGLGSFEDPDPVWSSAPQETLSLKREVDGWKLRQAEGGLRSVDDLKIELTGLSGDYPAIYFDLFPTVAFAESLRANPESYAKVASLVDNGIKGLIVYSVKSPTGAETLHTYNGAMRSCVALLDRTTPDSPLAAGIAQRVGEVMELVYKRKKQNGNGYHAPYLIYALGQYGYAPHTKVETLRTAVVQQSFCRMYQRMDDQERADLSTALHGPYGYSKAFVTAVEGLMAQAAPKASREAPVLVAKTLQLKS